MIRTDICIDPEIVHAFNEWISTIDVHSCDDLVPEFFDRIWGDPLTELSRFTRSNLTIRHLQDVVFHNGWVANPETGQLHIRFDDHAYGAVSMISYMIDAFFTPRGIRLNGTIVGVNRVDSMVYIYTVHESVISFEDQKTRSYIEEYARIFEEDDGATQMMRIIRDEMDLDFSA